MKKLLFSLAVVAMVAVTACGPDAAAIAEKAKQDSIAKAEETKKGKKK